MIESQLEVPIRQHPTVHGRLIEAGVTEFAARGFDGGSTRQIAILADTHQPQINYHFGSKVGLWKACLEQLLSDLDTDISLRLDGLAKASPVAKFEATIRAIVAFAARRPELNRIMMHEGSSPSDRLDWLVKTHLRSRYQGMRRAWEALPASARVRSLPSPIVYHTLVGSASLLYANSPEAELLGIDVTDNDLIEQHADALVEMFIGSTEHDADKSSTKQ